MKILWRATLTAAFLLAVLLLPGGRVFAMTAQEDSATYFVVAGDTLADIAYRYGTTAVAIMQANDLSDPDTIFVGQRLVIPGRTGGGSGSSGGTASGTIHTVKYGDTLADIAVTYGVSLRALMDLNGITEPSRIIVGQKLSIPGRSLPVTPTPGGNTQPPATGGRYTVQYGDTLARIAQKYGLSLQALAQANNLTNINIIRVGQVLVIPGASSGGNTPPPTTPPSSGGNSRAYVVQPGDTLNAIAYKYNVYVYDLVTLNGLSINSIIRVGQVLRVPPPVDMTVGKRILVDLSDQRVYVYEEGVLKWHWAVSTGRRGYRTITGTFRILDKQLWAYASTWNLKMPYWMGIYWAGKLENGFHGQVINSWGVRIWESYIGSPYTFGCVMLADKDMKVLYEWADIGTPIVIRP